MGFRFGGWEIGPDSNLALLHTVRFLKVFKNKTKRTNVFPHERAGIFFFFSQTPSFLFCFEVQPINNVVVVSGEQRRDSAIHIHVSILPQTPLPSRLAHNIEPSSMCYTIVFIGYPF